MCGIIGIASNKLVASNIIQSLKKLEYRGYDSAGIATLDNNIINEKKCSGRVDQLEKILFKNPSKLAPPLKFLDLAYQLKNCFLRFSFQPSETFFRAYAYHICCLCGLFAFWFWKVLPYWPERANNLSSNSISSNVIEEAPLETQEVVLENKEDEKNSLILENEYHEEQKTSNGLENFQIEENDTPELFDSDSSLVSEHNENEQDFSSFVKDKNEDEDELEIPAFLRRQKN